MKAKLPTDWQLYAVVIAAGALAGYLIARQGMLVYKSEGTPIGPSIGTDPTVNFVS